MRNQLSKKGGPAPHYRHQCPGCAFLGSFMHEQDGVHDLYHCDGYLVAVRSNNPEFTFGIRVSAFVDAGLMLRYRASYPSLERARVLARQRGLI